MLRFVEWKNLDFCYEYLNFIEIIYGGWKCYENKRELKLGYILFLNFW